MCLKITDSFLQDLLPLPYAGSKESNQMIRTGRDVTHPSTASIENVKCEVTLSATRSPTPPPPPSSGSRAANEPSATFSQSRRRPLLGAFNQEKAQVGAFSVIVKTLRWFVFSSIGEQADVIVDTGTGSPAIQRMLMVRNVMTSGVRMLPINVNQRYAS